MPARELPSITVVPAPVARPQQDALGAAAPSSTDLPTQDLPPDDPADDGFVPL